MIHLVRFGFAVIAMLFFAFCGSQKLSEEQKLTRFFEKDSVNIIVTDSGLGGLSVAADVVERLQNSGVFKSAKVTFFNAQPHLKSGYNKMKTTEQKVKIFNNALEAMEQKFAPDIILIACNTLSVIYEYTNYSKRAEIPVVGIVETGVNLIKSKLDEKENADVIIFATKTTVKQDKHRSQLKKMAIVDERMQTQACPKLAGEIERGSQSDTTKALVEKYVNQALAEREDSDKPLFISYNCTHYGYVNDLFKQAFLDRGIEVAGFLDPNPLMADFIFAKDKLNHYPSTQVNVRIVSQPELTPGKIASIYELISLQSDKTAEAMFEYEFVPEFFEWRSIAGVDKE